MPYEWADGLRAALSPCSICLFRASSSSGVESTRSVVYPSRAISRFPVAHRAGEKDVRVLRVLHGGQMRPGSFGELDD